MHKEFDTSPNPMQYRRIITPGASYFFTMVLQDRRSDLLIRKIKELRQAIKPVIECYPFIIDGIVVLPDHLHLLMTLPPDDANYSQRLGFIKSSFSRHDDGDFLLNSDSKNNRTSSFNVPWFPFKAST